jgi:putative spermidine/putrescine transport system permease protein
MTAEPRKPWDRRRELAILIGPGACLIALAVIPFALLLGVSVAHRDPGGLWSAGFEPTHFAALLDRAVLGTLAYTAVLAVIVAGVSTALGFPFAYFIAGMARRGQIAWLILLLSTLSLSEVLVAFSWQVMLARRIGLSAVFVWLGLLAEPQSLSPNFGAVVACLVYLVLPITVLLTYPALSRMDRHIAEAARTLGASPLRVFFTIILPMMRGPILSSAILATVFTIGTYVPPSVLGRPQDWTIAVLIGRTVFSGGDLPAAAAMSILLLTATLALTGVTLVIGRRDGPAP